MKLKNNWKEQKENKKIDSNKNKNYKKKQKKKILK